MAFLSTRAMLVLGVSMAVALHCAAAATYTVGGSTGWAVPTANTLYTSWASSNTFKVGDSLVFNFATNAHDVRQVTKTNYDSCNSTGALQTYATGPATVNLTASGPHYYLCSYPGHCSGGQKLSITVSAASPSPSPSPATSPAPSPSSSSSPPSATPTPTPSPSSSSSPSPSSSASPPPMASESPTGTPTTPAGTPTSPAGTGSTPSGSGSPPASTPTGSTSDASYRSISSLTAWMGMLCGAAAVFFVL
ncbi:hypothetical protein SUGI_0181740 [Cryptomeria japonica]|uniref:cucumber peeling cupredoxin n=1 Tax=Cryptomeria japonica TaxID=3369 RepID=UPI002408B8D6|nr:cucumber peeling cupredoxin [Cryptomeria japonica]XP_057830641.1 cucumber peeling cupredoxin [Cryptomeria japonica]GLJ11999.1 hypothetical protein SUGI_0181740 [Cryptomeria japonica]